MTETGWEAIGRIARLRRERLGLNQDELAQYGGPRVATIGKFERARQASFPLRTQHQIENALGWSRGTIEQVVSSIDAGKLTADDWEHDLVEEHIPDLSKPTTPGAGPGAQEWDEIHEEVATFAGLFRLVPVERRDEALRMALAAILPTLTTPAAVQLGAELRRDFPPSGGDGDADSTEPGGSAPKTLRPVDTDLYVDEAAYNPEQEK